jgi:hypothetical protein
MNLLPLCPNCHHTDQHDPHDPTKPIEPARLHLFRKYKDPLILSSQFGPVFRRMTILFDTMPDNYKTLVDELIRFIEALEMGSFYGSELTRLIGYKPSGMIQTGNSEAARRSQEAFVNSKSIHKTRVSEAREVVTTLLIEQLRYQNWPLPQKVK